MIDSFKHNEIYVSVFLDLSVSPKKNVILFIYSFILFSPWLEKSSLH